MMAGDELLAPVIRMFSGQGITDCVNCVYFCKEAFPFVLPGILPTST
jgi:hypothetical protein